jgi:hypothetical protein
MVDGLAEVAGGSMPGRGPPMQCRDQLGLPIAQFHLEQLGE